MIHHNVEPTLTVGQIAAEHPATVNVFLDYDLDFCCGGNRKLQDACEEAGVPAEEVLGRLNSTINGSDSSRESSWVDRPSMELIDHIIKTYHNPLRTQLPQIMVLAHRVEEAHGPSYGPSLTRLRETLHTLQGELLAHLEDEELRVFPLIQESRSDEISEKVEQLIQDHRKVAEVLLAIRDLTTNFTLPEYACNTWSALWWNLESLEKDLKEHIHLENNVLFTNGLKSEREAS